MAIRLTKQSESSLVNQILQYAKLKGWRSIHLRPARTSRGWATAIQGDGIGFPDLVLLRGRRAIVAECKVGRNKLTLEQHAWLQAFRLVDGCEVYEWRETSWDEIEKVLT